VSTSGQGKEKTTRGGFGEGGSEAACTRVEEFIYDGLKKGNERAPC